MNPSLSKYSTVNYQVLQLFDIKVVLISCCPVLPGLFCHNLFVVILVHDDVVEQVPLRCLCTSGTKPQAVLPRIQVLLVRCSNIS